MADANGLVEAMKKAALDAVEAEKPVNLCFGKVTRVSPLEINVEQKMTLGEGQLVLARHVTDYETEVTVEWETEEKGGGSGEASYSSHSHKDSGKKRMVMYNSLALGETVLLARKQGGQKYVVLDRIGGAL